jgi:site-specific DNA recombinase
MYITPELLQIDYDIYIRRSSDDTDHQVASLGSQKEVLVKLKKDNKLKVLRIVEESMSAKQPGRPIFNEEIQRIEQGIIQGLVIWDLSRASRNPVDSGTLSWLLQKEKLKAIVTPHKVYLSQDNVLLMNIEFGQATQYLRDLSKNVKRGQHTKNQKGQRPGSVPEGYLNDSSEGKGNGKNITDPIRFPLVRKMWDMLLSGNYTVPQILQIANEDWKYTTVKHKKLGGTPLSRAGLYRIFTNSFYTSVYEYPVGSGDWYEGKHEKMIEQWEFDKAQVLLGRKGKQRAVSRAFAFTGMMRCGECESAVTAEELWQVICSNCKHKFSSKNAKACTECNTLIAQMKNPKILHYIFYRCARKNKIIKCTQKYVRLELLEDQVDFLLSKIEIPESFKMWAIEHLNELHDQEAMEQGAIAESVTTKYKDCLDRINNLIKLKISPMNSDGSVLSDEDFKKQITLLQKEKKDIEQEQKTLAKRADEWLELSQKTFNFACYARLRFQHGTLHEKKEILATIGSNLVLKDKLLSLTVPKPFIAIQEAKIETDRIVARFKPEEKIDLTAQMMYLYQQDNTLRDRRDSNSQPLP